MWGQVGAKVRPRVQAAKPHKRRILRQNNAAGSTSAIRGKPLPDFVLRKPKLRPAGRAAFVAAFFVMAPFITGGPAVVPAMAGDPAHPAGMQSRLEAEYTASISGIPIGRGNWIIEISDDQYTAAGSGTTTGILRFFTGARGTGAAHGTVSGGQPEPTSYGATITYDHKVDDVRMALVGGNVTDFTVEPPLPPLPDRIPVTDADRRGVFDPMTSMLNRVAGSGDPVSPEACNRKVAVV